MRRQSVNSPNMISILRAGGRTRSDAGLALNGLPLTGCRRRTCRQPGRRGTSRRHSPCRRAALWRRGRASSISAAPLSTLIWPSLSSSKRSSLAIVDCKEIRVQPLFWGARYVGKSSYYKRLAALRWAFRWAGSVISWSGIPPLATSAAEVLLKAPRLF